MKVKWSYLILEVCGWDSISS